MIRRCFLAALLFCAVSCPMMAQGGKVNVLYLDGTAHEVQMSQVAKLTVADGNVKLLSRCAGYGSRRQGEDRRHRARCRRVRGEGGGTVAQDG